VRISSLTVSVLALVLVATSAAGQSGASVFASASQDSAAYETVLLTLRDSVAQVRAEMSRFRRDLQLAGAQTVVGRARSLGASCTGLRRALTAAAPTLRAPASASPGLRSVSRDLLAQIQATGRVLQQECERGLAPEGPGAHADSLKAWGPHRTGKLEQDLNELDGAIAAFARVANIELKPRLP